MSSSISEFERTKPVITMKKLKNCTSAIDERMARVETISEQIFLQNLHAALKDTVASFEKGE